MFFGDKATTYFIDTVSLLELVVAQDEPLFRLLMSPLKMRSCRYRQGAKK